MPAEILRLEQKANKVWSTHDAERALTSEEQRALRDIMEFLQVHRTTLMSKRIEDLTDEKLHRLSCMHQKVREWEQDRVVKLCSNGARSILGFSSMLVLDQEKFDDYMTTFGDVQAWRPGMPFSRLKRPMKATRELLRQCALMKNIDADTSLTKYVFRENKVKCNCRLLFSQRSLSQS
ncbi:hypothetical protein GUITHDRAFT_119363 [Guillardia theta CCMP2712]|uniref:Uncharacterized protein n=1 Tax=Guillardia theta (strain CCMP2712) TaxID=905079 RepID=L1IDY1_GUITC|nr:hypothetical protein GUITHDRAFT_119363 [Guillardia theta CCMP2712]EKX34438.1 hypothetical protein GUITHDRAFT_119363 [Guillardia theta CCMP2712]|eukprot:XP_005821418.1 hypothetical protein GUITHDRAFT_119363 [Guillardia theta CCMP2712]